MTHVFSDPVTLDDVFEAQRLQFDEGHWSWALVVDCQGVTWLPSTEDIQRLRSRVESVELQRYGRRGPVAFVAQAGSALYGMLRMLQILVEFENVAVRVCESHEEAAEWLREIGY